MTATQPAVRPQDGPNTNPVAIYLPAVTGGAPGAAGPLHERLARTIDRTVYAGGADGPLLAALAILGHPAITQALAAQALLERLDAAHRWRWWSDGVSRSCTCGTPACGVRAALDGQPTAPDARLGQR